MASQLAFKSRIASTESLKKIFNAQEMIASSRIAKTRDVALAAKPFSDAIYDAVRSLAAHTNIEHPILGKKEDNPRVAVLALTSDRGMAGAYTSSIIRETEELLNRLEADGRKPELFVYGRRGVNYYKYRNREVAATWEGESDAPSVAMAARISKALFDTYMAPASAGGVSEFSGCSLLKSKYWMTAGMIVLTALPLRVSRAVRAVQAALGKPCGGMMMYWRPRLCIHLNPALKKYWTASCRNMCSRVSMNACSLLLLQKLQAARMRCIRQQITPENWSMN